MYFRYHQTRDLTYLSSENNEWQLSKCVLPVIAKFVGILSDCGCCEKKSLLLHTCPLWSLGAMGMRVRVSSNSLKQARMTEGLGTHACVRACMCVCAGWGEGWWKDIEHSGQTAKKRGDLCRWQGLRGTGTQGTLGWGVSRFRDRRKMKSSQWTLCQR